MLIKTQKGLIAERKGGKNKERGDWKTGDYALRQLLKNRLESISDILEIIDVLPDKQMKKVVTPEQIAAVLKVLKKLLDILPPEETRRTPGDGRFRAHLPFRVDMGSKLRCLDNAVVGAEITYLATEGEREYWSEFHDTMHTFNEIIEKMTQYPTELSQKEFNDLVKQLTKSREDVQVKSANWLVGDPKEGIDEADPLSDAERKVLTLGSKKALREE